MTDNKEALITFSYILPATISVLYIIGMGARFYDLRSNIKAEPIKLNYAIILRITLLTLDIAAEFIEFLLVILYSKTSYYYVSGVLFINISAIIMQILLMVYEYRKRVPMFFAHKIYWILNWIALGILFALLIINNNLIVEYCLVLFRVIVYTVLLIFTLFCRKQDLAEFEEIGFFKSEIPDIDISDSQRPRLSTLNCILSSYLDGGQSQFIQIEVKKRWNIVNDEVEVKLDVTIIGCDRNYKLKKTVSEIFQMHTQLVFECEDYFEHHPNDLLQMNFLIKQIADSQDLALITNVQRYLNITIGKIDLITPSFMDFIDLQMNERVLVDEIKQATKMQSLHKSSMIVKKNQPQQQKKWDIQPQYLPYMDIRITDHQTVRIGGESYVQYTMITQFGDENAVVQKRFKEFYEFGEQLKITLGMKNFPPLPQKTVIKMTEEEIVERQIDLEIFMRVILNDRQYHHSMLFRFIGMSQTLEDQIKQLHVNVMKEGEYIQKLSIKNTGFEEVVDKDGDKFYRYSFAIGEGEFKHTILKRFTQFEELHNILKVRYSNLPQMPQKLTALQQQINPSLRSVNLTQYLQDLRKVQGIGENPHLRQFLEIKDIMAHIDDNTNLDSQGQFESILQRLEIENNDIESLEKMRGRLWQ